MVWLPVGEVWQKCAKIKNDLIESGFVHFSKFAAVNILKSMKTATGIFLFECLWYSKTRRVENTTHSGVLMLKFEVISNTQDSVLLAIQTTQISSKKTLLHVAFSTLFSAFGQPDETTSLLFNITHKHQSTA